MPSSRRPLRRFVAKSLNVPESRANPPVVDARVPFGIPEIDEMLEGGLVPHRPYLIVGPSGTGKTTLALQFLCEGIRRGEPGLYVTIEDPPNEVRVDHRALPPEIDRIDVFDAIPDVMRYEHIPFKDISSVRDVVPFQKVPREIRKTPEFTSVEITVSALEQLLRTEVQRRGYVRLVVDSLTALQYFCMKGIEPMSGAQAFLRFLSSLRTTSLLTVEAPLEDAESPERSLARGEVRLFRWELDGVTVRAIGVEKFRGSSHDVRLHPYRIGPNGIDINLDLTISRDTRRLVEPAVSVVSPALAAGGTPPPTLLGSLSDEVRDLVALGVDVRPVRAEVEAALAAVREGRPAESVNHIARVSSLNISLAQSLLHAPRKERDLSKGAREAFERIVQRADAARGGVPPTRLPAPDVLDEQLSSILSLLGGPTPTVLPPPAEAPPGPSPALPAEPAPPPTAPPAPTPAAAPAPADAPSKAAEPVPPTPSPTPVAVPLEEQTSPRPPPPNLAPTSLVDGEPRPLPSPPRSTPDASPEAVDRAAATSDGSSATSSAGLSRRGAIPARPLPEPPPLPTPFKAAPAPPGRPPERPRGAAAESPTHRPTGASRPGESPAAVPHRRRRAVPSKKAVPATVPKEAGPPLPALENSATAGAAAPKPKRKTVRKRKAPTVVTAIPEAIPPGESESRPTGAPSPPPSEDTP
jgi:KaiC/GvpD/RAD55 family RecA-like ATPase